jgi:hypothetical protein
MSKFPSLAWFKTGLKNANEDPEFRELGSCDASVGVKIGGKVYAIVFEAFAVTSVTKIGVDDLRDLDFYFDMSRPDWESFLSSLNGDEPISLNSLDLRAGIVKSFDESRRITFPRYHLTFQRFFAAAASA